MSHGRNPWRARLGAVAIVGLLVPMLVQLSPAAGQARTIDDACPTDEVPEDGFTDTGPNGSVQEVAVDCIAAYGITVGKTATSYGTDDSTLRMQMGSFISRFLGGDDVRTLRPSPLPAFDGTNDFPCDVEDNNVHRVNINRLAQAEIALGGPGGKPDDCFGPVEAVKRDQMASFVVRALDFAGVDVSTPSASNFPDVPPDNVHRANINRLAALGVVQGFADGQYKPGNPVTRGQMAFFLTRALDVMVDEGLFTPAFGAPVLTSLDANDNDTNGQLSTGDDLVLTFEDPVIASSSATITDGEGDTTRLDSTEEADPANDGVTPAEFAIATASANTLTITVGDDVDITPGSESGGGAQGVIDGTITITAASGILDAETGQPWDPTADPAASVVFSQVTLSDGKTNGPDLVSIAISAGSNPLLGESNVDFTFDEVVATPTASSASGFELIQQDNTRRRGVSQSSFPPASSNPTVQGDGSTVRVVFQAGSPGGSVNPSSNPVVRAVVEAGYVFDRSTTPVPNPQTSVTVANNGNTSNAPNLVSATTTTGNKVIYVFDREVAIASQSGFALFNNAARVQVSTAATVRSDATQVEATFSGSPFPVAQAKVAGVGGPGTGDPNNSQPTGPAVRTTGTSPVSNEDDTVPVGVLGAGSTSQASTRVRGP